jgi:ubiquinol-cytochrome c reductase cytochrome c subunit
VPVTLGVAALVTLVLVGGAHRSTAAPAGHAPAAASTAAAAGDVDAGRQLWLRDCAICHGANGQGSDAAPRINRNGVADVYFQVSTGRMPLPPTGPRGTKLRAPQRYTAAQTRDLTAYAATFIAGPAIPHVDIRTANVAAGGVLYRTNCAPCHQAAGSGGALAYGTVAPPLSSSTPTQVVAAMRVGPGTMPVFPPGVLDTEEANQVARYVQYLHNPSNPGGASLWHLGPVPEGLVAWIVGMGALLLLCRWLGERDPLES